MARGLKKVYMIVTNDEYEIPIYCDVVGRKAVADFIGMSETHLWYCIKNDKWIGDYKVIDLGYMDEQDEFIPNENITDVSDEERKRNIQIRREKKHSESVERIRINRKAYEESHAEELREKSRAYYWSHREERCEYGKRRRRMMREKRKRQKMICNG